MTYDPPTPPSTVSDALLAEIDDWSPQELQDLATYAEALAEHREREIRLEEQKEEEDIDDVPDTDRPEGVPAKATITTKTINENQYYYWQWREGDTVKSQYKGPVNPDE